MKKKTWMKAVALSLAAVTVLGLAGCGGSDKPEGNATKGQAESAIMQKIKKSGKLVIGTASGYPPYEFVDTSTGEKTVIGIDIALGQAIADKLGVKLEVQDMNFQAVLASLASGKVDMALSGITPTDERKKAMDFTEPYLESVQKIVIRKADAGKYKALEDFKGMPIGVQKSTIQEAIATKMIKEAKIVALSHVPDAILELKQGKVDGVVVENIVAKQYLVYNEDLVFSDVVFEGEKPSPTVGAVPKGSEDFLKIVNEVIKENQNNGNFDKWIDMYSKLAVQNAE